MPPEAVASPAPTPITPGPAVTVQPAQSAPAAAPPSARDLAEMTPVERHRRSVEAGDAQSGRYDPAKYVQVRDAHGGLAFKDRETGAIVSESGDASAGEPGSDQPQAENQKYTVGRFSVSEAEIAAMMERQAIDDQRKATLPATPADYKAELPSELALPGGQKFAIDANDPAIADARTFAHQNGLSQAQFSAMLGIYAAREATQQALINEAHARELAKLGPTATQRVDALARWITAEMGTADAKPIMTTMVSDAHVRFYEKVMHKIISQNVAPFSQQHRDIDTGTVDDATWSRMSYGEKKAYADSRSAGGRR